MILPRRYLSFVLLPLIIYILTDQLFYSFANANLIGPGFEVGTMSAHHEATQRIKFLAGLSLYIALTVLVFALFLIELLRPDEYDKSTRRDVLVTFFVVALCALSYGAITSEDRLYQRLGGDLYEQILNVCTVIPQNAEAQGPDTCLFGERTEGTPAGFDFALDLGATFAVIGMLSATLGSILALAQSQEDIRTRSVEDVFRLPRLFLYVVSACFTLGMVSLITWLNYPAPFLTGEVGKAHEALRNSVSLYFGISYSMMILSAYVPVAIVLTLRLRTAVDDRSDPIVPSLKRTIENTLAFLAPILTSLVAAAGAGIFDQFGLGN